MHWKRHTLLDISDTRRKELLAELADNSPTLREKLKVLLLPDSGGTRVPGIVRREELAPRSGCIPIGFCSPLADENGRLRVAAFINPEDVVKVTSPYELLSRPIPLRTSSTMALAAVRDQAAEMELTLGVWGSAALELYTSLPYTHSDSDLDLLVPAASREKLCRFLEKIRGLEERFHLRIDLEVDLPSGFGVNLKELLGKTRTVIGKSFAGVEMFNREQILDDLPH